MKPLTWILIAFTIAGAALDIYTTEALLASGLFHEQNPLFYLLGSSGFQLFYIALTTAACLIILQLDRLCQRKGCSPKLLTRGLALLSVYAVLHWFLGVNQLIQLIRSLGGA